MKKLRQKLWILILLGMVSGGFAMPNQEDLFKDLSIDVPKHTKAQYIYGDNIAGYVEGYTHSYRKGQGYLMVKSAVFSDFASSVNQKGSFLSPTVHHINNRKKDALMAHIRPDGVIHDYPNGVSEKMSLLSHEYGVVLKVQSENPEYLSLFPMLNLRSKTTEVKERDGVVVFSPQRKPKKMTYPIFVAMVTAEPSDFVLGNSEKIPELKKPLKISHLVVAPVFDSKEKTRVLTLYIAFGFNADEAYQKALRFKKQHIEKIYAQKVYGFLTRSFLWTSDMEYNRASMWAKLGSYFLVEEEFGKGIWAGLPWFKNNWGRDTFISLPGTLLVSGQFEEAKAVITNFSTYQNRGTQTLSVIYQNKEQKKSIKNYIKSHFGKRLSYKKGSISHTLDISYMEHLDLLETKVSEFRKAFPDAKIETRLTFDKTFGRVPNLVTARNSVMYNTTDGTPWFIREVLEYLRYTGDKEFVKQIYPTVRLAIEGAISNYVDDKGYLTHADADTWMDARINGKEPWSARGNRANDIQALWFTALRAGSLMASQSGDTQKAKEWMDLSEKLRKNIKKDFWSESKQLFADRLRTDGSLDLKVRPNQLMMISVPMDQALLDPVMEAKIVKNAISTLLTPYGILSLDPDHPYFHPYHEKWEWYNKDSAYHNGTIWGWNFGPTTTAMTKYGLTDLAYTVTTNLGAQILYMGCRGNMSELVEAARTPGGKIHLSGTFAQAWSVAEYARNVYQDYAGFRPDLLENRITLIPSVPSGWRNFEGSFAFGKMGRFSVKYQRSKTEESYELSFSGWDQTLTIDFMPWTGKRLQSKVILSPNETAKLTVKGGKIYLNGNEISSEVALKSYADIIGHPGLREVDLDKNYPVLKEKDYLKKIILSGEYK